MNDRISIERYRAEKKREQPFPSRWQDYERQKQAWLRTNPEATHKEYEAAMLTIAKRCGV